MANPTTREQLDTTAMVGDPSAALRGAFHDLSTPLAVTSGYLHILYKHWDRLTDEQRRMYAIQAMHALAEAAEVLIQKRPGGH